MQKAATVSSTCYQCHYRAAALTFLPISCFVLLLKHNELQFLFLDEYIMYFSNAQRCRWRPAGWDVAVPMNTNGVQQGGGGGGEYWVTVCLNLYKVQQSIYLLDFQRKQGDQFTFMNFCALVSQNHHPHHLTRLFVMDRMIVVMIRCWYYLSCLASLYTCIYIRVGIAGRPATHLLL